MRVQSPVKFNWILWEAIDCRDDGLTRSRGRDGVEYVDASQHWIVGYHRAVEYNKYEFYRGWLTIVARIFQV